MSLIAKFESFANNDIAVVAMNKAMFFFVNCGYDEVKKLLYSVFDEDLAKHIFKKYNTMAMDSQFPFFETYFELDTECRKEILSYIADNYNDEQKL